MQRDDDDWDDADKDDDSLDELRPEDLGIDVGKGPDVILGRELRRVEQAARRDATAEAAVEYRPYVPYLTLEQLSDLKPRQLSWLWPGRIPLGRMTLIAGESQVGKSLVALDIAARVSRAACWPDLPGPHAGGPGATQAGNVLILGMNSAAAADVRERLAQAGADLSKVFFADGVFLPESSGKGWKRSLSLVDDQGSLYKTIRELSLRLVIIDPLWAFTGARGHAHTLRIAELAELAAQSGAAIVGVADLQRDNRGRGSLRVKGERALAAAAHSVWGIVPHPEDEDMRVLLPLKTEPAAGAAPGTIDQGVIGKFGLEFLIAAGQVAWDSQTSPLTVEAVLAAERFGGELESVAEWLRALLSRGSLPAKQVFAQARECGFSIGTLKRAKAAIRVHVDHEGDPDNLHWVWSLEGSAGIESNSNGARIDEITCAPCKKPAKLIEISPAVE